MKNLKNSSLDYIAIFEHCVYDKETVYLHFISDIRRRLRIYINIMVLWIFVSVYMFVYRMDFR